MTQTKEIAEEYQEGRSLKSIASSKGVSYWTARSAVIAQGVPIRNHSQAGRLRGEDKRDEILAFVSTFCEEHGYSPTVREIGKAVSLTSPGTVQKHVEYLISKNRLSQGPGPRTLRVTA